MEGFGLFPPAAAAVKSLILPRDCGVFELQIFLGALNELPPNYQWAPKPLRWDVKSHLYK